MAQIILIKAKFFLNIKESYLAIAVTANSHPLEVWDAEEDLHHRAEVASVAQIFNACVTGTKHGLQLHSRLLDHLPLADPWPGIIVPVMSVLRLSERVGYETVSLSPSLNFSPHDCDILLFSASAACLFQSVTSDRICGGPTQPPPPQRSRYLKPEFTVNYSSGFFGEKKNEEKNI